MDLSRAKYILPNMFTLSSIVAGMYSIQLSTTATGVEEMTLAAWLVMVSMVCDTCDGRVARLTRTESEFGVQLDSLADAISFGVAPGFLLYNWGLSELGLAGLLLASAYTAGTVLRLARFNVMAHQSEGPARYFLGLPSPLAAGMVASLVLAHVSFSGQIATGASESVAAVALLLGGLMVSNVRYRTFKDVKFRGPAALVLVLLLAAVTALAVVYKAGVALVVVTAVYIVVGLCGGLLNLGRNVLGGASDDDGADGVLQDLRDSER
ncbi:CDP-diacylglycerol--serine O-phosphatidyltransferase [Bradymonadaceae bacterium TMQ3]|uniref:CDP-diacylglycerol--serine O-phosphatidyltransferase n=1 Tax=Lujinxingia sediminis TaxID=2480984 RepID=A0ABY0CRQ6_9DELT|nr:CDP-diacylglycerol--serine O-phosphatidyltransferase [Lujinxingia sediminis]RDV38300.1 CDP-diacylglycerol--serine O-phosphatidyltransferase [Bradymonadaceae bacterium TMQ3]RVU43497.1 CDP-diacylglycerol--serine O-phosphatidyltransferase [Lujinxingia sediminis]